MYPLVGPEATEITTQELNDLTPAYGKKPCDKPKFKWCSDESSSSSSSEEPEESTEEDDVSWNQNGWTRRTREMSVAAHLSSRLNVLELCARNRRMLAWCVTKHDEKDCKEHEAETCEPATVKY